MRTGTRAGGRLEPHDKHVMTPHGGTPDSAHAEAIEARGFVPAGSRQRAPLGVNNMTTDHVGTRRVITQTPTRILGRPENGPVAESHLSGPWGSEMASRVIILGFGLVQIVLGARIVLLLLDAREANGLVAGILNVSQVSSRRSRESSARTSCMPPVRSSTSRRSWPWSGITIVELIVLWAVGIFRAPARPDHVVTGRGHPSDGSSRSGAVVGSREFERNESSMGFIAWIVVGAIAGFLAKSWARVRAS